MLPPALLRVSAHLEGERVVPHYFGARDEPWLRALLAECARFVGRTMAEWRERVREPQIVRAPKAKLQVMLSVLEPLCRERPEAVVPPKEGRAALFRAASNSAGAPRAAVLSSVAASFGVRAVDLEAAIFADLPMEQRVAALPDALSPARLAAEANLAIASSLVRRAKQVRVIVHGDARALVRHARRAGLICRESRLEHAPRGVVLELSGPLALFHHGQVYAQALASLIPRLANCEHFELTATCALGRDGVLSSFLLRSGDPIASARGPAPSEARLQRKFERDFPRVAPGWKLIFEPEAVAVGDAVQFPDFELVPASAPDQRWRLEIVGFWTPDYLQEKLRRLQAAGIERFVLCIDHRGGCAEGERPVDPRIVPYKTRIDPRAVLAVIR